METIDMLKTAGFSSTGILVVLIAYRIFKSINGHRVVSTCCGKKIDVGFAVEPITPDASAAPRKERPRKEELVSDGATADEAVAIEIKNPMVEAA